MGDSVPEAPKEINANAKTAGVEQKTGMPQNFRRREWQFYRTPYHMIWSDDSITICLSKLALILADLFRVFTFAIAYVLILCLLVTITAESDPVLSELEIRLNNLRQT